MSNTHDIHVYRDRATDEILKMYPVFKQDIRSPNTSLDDIMYMCVKYSYF
jgi:hypothetical protein